MNITVKILLKPPYFHAMLGNLSRSLACALKWAIRHAQPAAAPFNARWSGELAEAVDQAISVARHYNNFEVCFQAFHRDLQEADILPSGPVRFVVPGAERDRQVSAYQKGLRRSKGPFVVQDAGLQPQDARLREAFDVVLGTCRQTGSLSFEYADPWDLWRESLPGYRDRVKALLRRDETLSLGPYGLNEFNEFYTALIAICAAHDLLCFRWGQLAGTFPLESAVIVRAVTEWAEVLADLSGVTREKCLNMVADLTFSDRSLDLHVHPFVPLLDGGNQIALAPPFPLHSRHDENILRVCSQRRPEVYDLTSVEKEGEMRAALRAAGPRYGVEGSLRLPDPLPNVDLVMVDDASSTVVVAELKWLRKTLRPAEIPNRDAELLKGIGQLEKIQTFLAEAPSHFASQGRLRKPMNRYDHVYYLLVARDYWRWVEPRNAIAIVEFDALVHVLAQCGDLHEAVNKLLTYEWLPVEGCDFEVRYDTATAHGVSIESQVFYPLANG